jgi:hypothetical protein
MFIGKLIEDGRAMLTPALPTIEEVRAEGRRRWHTAKFDVIEIKDEMVEDGVFEAIRYVPDQTALFQCGGSPYG